MKSILALVLLSSAPLLVVAIADASASEPKTATFVPGKRGMGTSGGYYPSSPLAAPLSEWTFSLWARANASQNGVLAQVVLDEQDNEKITLSHEAGTLVAQGPVSRDLGESWEIRANASSLAQWRMLTVVYHPQRGVTLYVDGDVAARIEKGRFETSTHFARVHFGVDRTLRKGELSHNDYFDGVIDDFRLFSKALEGEEIKGLFEEGSVPDSLVAFNDFENVNHKELAFPITDAAYLEEAKELYDFHCGSCHSKDGVTPPINPLARAFTEQPMQNGGDPYSMFETLSYGYKNMMAAVQLKPEERYKAIHYLRERIIKPRSPELYVEVPADYAAAMPEALAGTLEESQRLEALTRSGYLRDYGKAFYTRFARKEVGEDGKPKEKLISRNALVVDLGDETTIAYELGKMAVAGAWEGGYLDLGNTLNTELRASGSVLADFDDIPGSETWRWAWDGKAEASIPDLGYDTVYPEEQFRYNGHYAYGDEIALSYEVQGRDVLESPKARAYSGIKTIHHRLSVAPGSNPLELVVSGIGKSKTEIKGLHAYQMKGGQRYSAWVQGDAKGVRWRESKDGELVLTIPASSTPLNLDIAVADTSKGSDYAPDNLATDLRERAVGGPRRWQDTHVLKGRLGVSHFQGYALDSVPVPLENAFNSWMRTSALAFYPDGRLAVATLGGDIWIVSGIDGALDQVTWQRFAAGMNEPMGMKVIDGTLTVTTRGRLIKLHDFNDDGEADFYESFFNESEPSSGWHAYSFDLEVDKQGNYYYARVGGFSDWSTPGGIVKVAPDGRRSEVVGEGFRVPNGIGLLPNGQVTFGDNQGRYVPASKIAISTPGSFHGAGSWFKHEGKYDPATIMEPIVYMPQELDSSSGSQLWVDDPRFGPLSGQYFHTSYGRGTTMYVMMDTVGGVTQGAVYSLPMEMESGTMRVARNPVDGQLYYTGLTGWQAGGTSEGSVQRLRFTGEKGLYLVGAKARKGRLELQFNREIDPGSLKNMDTWQAEMWNYKWSSNYGSDFYKVSEEGVKGVDALGIAGLRLTDDERTLVVDVPDVKPCHTLKLQFELSGKEAGRLSGPLYFTIHELPE